MRQRLALLHVVHRQRVVVAVVRERLDGRHEASPNCLRGRAAAVDHICAAAALPVADLLLYTLRIKFQALRHFRRQIRLRLRTNLRLLLRGAQLALLPRILELMVAVI